MMMSKMADHDIAADETAFFKRCSKCQTEWASREDFLRDPDLVIIGYQVSFDDLNEGLFYFNHSCKTTLAIYAREFVDLYQGPIFSIRATGTEDCPGHCLHKSVLKPCPAKCECAFVREVIQIIRHWPKAGTA